MSEGRIGAWWKVGNNRIMGNCFYTAGQTINPFGELFAKWCPRCKMVVDSDTDASHRAGIYTYKTTCNRCGKVIESGAYASPLVGGPDQALPTIMFEWLSEGGRDRR